jgi:hypothetical protein
MFHIAGTRMIQIGIDALSRRERQVEALEKPISEIIPLHLSPVERSPTLINWLQSWLGEKFFLAEPEDWFYRAQQSGEYSRPPEKKTWVWNLHPAAAIYAIE